MIVLHIHRHQGKNNQTFVYLYNLVKTTWNNLTQLVLPLEISGENRASLVNSACINNSRDAHFIKCYSISKQNSATSISM